MTTAEKHKTALESAVKLIHDLTGCKTIVLLLEVDGEKFIQPGGDVADVYDLILSAAGMVCAKLRKYDDKPQVGEQV